MSLICPYDSGTGYYTLARFDKQHTDRSSLFKAVAMWFRLVGTVNDNLLAAVAGDIVVVTASLLKVSTDLGASSKLKLVISNAVDARAAVQELSVYCRAISFRISRHLRLRAIKRRRHRSHADSIRSHL